MEIQKLCVVCKGKGFCGKPCPILAKFKSFQPKIKTEFSGSSPPEIFVGHYGYPKIFTGILAPNEYGDTSIMSMPEEWHSQQADIMQILLYRSKMIYSRFETSIKQTSENSKLKEIMQEVALASKPAAMEFKLKRKPELKFQMDLFNPVIGNPAPLIQARFEENPKVEKKVDYLVSDTDVKSVGAIQELYRANIPVSSLIKILSAGLLGLKKQRKLVPTRWAITAVDSTISEQLINKIKYHPLVNEFLLFHSNYLGNYYEILMMPRQFSFEVIEAKMPGSVWNPQGTNIEDTFVCTDYESWYGRKDYAVNCAGGYYAPRLAIAEYLDKIRRQASVLVMRECRPEYFAPCGVGVLREAVRGAFTKKPERFSTLDEALAKTSSRFKLKMETFIKASKLIKEYKTQKTITDFFR